MIPFNKPKEIEKSLKIMAFVFIIALTFMFAHSAINNYLYPQISSDQHIYGKVIRAVPYQSIAKIELENGTHCRLNPSRNYLYKPYDLNEFLTTDDFIEKKANSDTLHIRRGSKVYFFILGKDINREHE